MRIYLTICSVFIVFFGHSQNWTQVSNFINEGRHHPITFANDNFGYVMSGSYLDDAYKYDKSTDSWSQLQNVPFTGRGYSYGVALGDKLTIDYTSGSATDGTFLVASVTDSDVFTVTAASSATNSGNVSITLSGAKQFNVLIGVKTWNFRKEQQYRQPLLKSLNQRHNGYYLEC